MRSMSIRSTIPLSADAIGNILAFTDLVVTRRLAGLLPETAKYLDRQSLWKQKCIIERKGLITPEIKTTDWKGYYDFINRRYGGEVVIANDTTKITFRNVVGSIHIDSKITWLLDDFGRVYSLIMEDKNLVWIRQDLPDSILTISVNIDNNCYSAIAATKNGKIYQCGAGNRYNKVVIDPDESTELPSDLEVLDIGINVDSSYNILYSNGEVYHVVVSEGSAPKIEKYGFKAIFLYPLYGKSIYTGLVVTQIDFEKKEIIDINGELYQIHINKQYDRTVTEMIWNQDIVSFSLNPGIESYKAKAVLPDPPEQSKIIENRFSFGKINRNDTLNYDPEEFKDMRSEMENGLRDIRDGDEVS